SIELAKEKLAQFQQNHPKELADKPIQEIFDLSAGYAGLPNTEGLIIFYGKKSEIRVIVRPSGTEPKMKCYVEVKDKSESVANKTLSLACEQLTRVLS
ncbi:MAG: phospho-sugar mutase, partial [Candidatus Fonsibacter sp.]